MFVKKEIILLSIFLIIACNDYKPDALAIIGSRRITINAYVDRYKSIRKKINLPDNGQTRSEIYQNMIDEYLLISEAEEKGYNEDEIGIHTLEEIKIKELIDIYLQKKIFSTIKITEDDLKALYIRLNTKIKARHIYASSGNEAKELYQRVINGESFTDLARETFDNPQLRESGGSLGYFTVDEMDAGFEDAAFALDIGEISKPVRTAQGYSIIQVQDRITKPLLIESEYAKHKYKLEAYWLYRMQKKTARVFSDSIRAILNISFNQVVLDDILNNINSGQTDFKSYDIENVINNLNLDQEIVTSKLGSWNLKTLRDHAKFTSEKQKNRIKNRENLEDFIAGLIIRAYILSEAKKLKLHELAEYKTAVKEKYDDYLYQRILDTITDEIVIPEDTLFAYYHKYKNQYMAPPMIRLSEIVLDSKARAEKIEKMLKTNKSFAYLAKKYSSRKWSAENNGDIGNFYREELGRYANRLTSLKPGQWTGPVQMDNKFIFFQCTAKYAARELTFDEARPEIVKSLRSEWKNNSKKITLAEIRSRTRLVTFPEKLRTIKLN